MNRRIWRSVLACVLIGGTLMLVSTPAPAQTGVQEVSAEGGVENTGLAASKGARASWLGAVVDTGTWSSIWSELEPHFTDTTVAWIAVIVILLLTLQGGPSRSWWHTLDGIILALTVLLLPLRSSFHAADTLMFNQSVQWVSYLLLTLIGLYWLVRGLALLQRKQAPAARTNLAEGASFVLIIAGFFLASGYITKEPVSPTSYDGVIGGVCVADTGKLPYGDAPAHDQHSPMLYLVHGGVVKLGELLADTSNANLDIAEPTVDYERIRWSDRGTWLVDPGWKQFDTTPMKLVNLLLFVLLLLGLAGIGHGFHSVAMGQTLVALCCFFPGVLECLVRPEIMIPAVLLTWTIALLRLPGLGSLLSGLTLVFAGLAWPWAWLLLPALMAYYFRRGWHSFGVTVGVLGSFALVAVGITTLVAPAPPRGDGALAAAGRAPEYELTRAEDGTLVVERAADAAAPPATFKSGLWNALLQHDSVTIADSGLAVMMPAGVTAESVRFDQVTLGAGARDAALAGYRSALSAQTPLTRFWVGFRTLLENTWLPDHVSPPQHEGTWNFWAAQYGNDARWTIARRSLKVVLGLLALFVAYLLYRGRQPGVRELVAAFLVICAGAALISQSGMIANWAWFIPVILSAYAVRDPEEAMPAPVAASAPTPIPGVAPRPTSPPPGTAPRPGTTTPFTTRPAVPPPSSSAPSSTSSSDLGAAPRITVEQEKL